MRAMVSVALAAAALWAMPAAARDVIEGDVSLGSGSLIQSGRLSRNGVQQDFANSEPYPGEINTTTSYYYTTIAVPFAFNAGQDVYYEITFDDEATDLFASAYDGAYSPTNKQANWIGDAGSSGNYFPGDARFFDVVVPQGGSLVFVVNSTSPTLGQTSSAHYLIQAYSDSEYDEDFPATPSVPEPASWAMMIAGFGVVGAAMRRRPQRVAAAT